MVHENRAITLEILSQLGLVIRKQKYPHRTPNEQHRNPDKLTKRNTVVSVHVARRNAEDGTRESSHHIGNIVATGTGDQKAKAQNLKQHRKGKTRVCKGVYDPLNKKYETNYITPWRMVKVPCS